MGPTSYAVFTNNLLEIETNYITGDSLCDIDLSDSTDELYLNPYCDSECEM